MVLSRVEYLALASPCDMGWVESELQGDELLEGWNLKSFNDELRISDSLFLVDKSVLVGFILYRQVLDIREVTLLMTHPEQRGRGHMRGLLRGLVDQLNSSEKIWLEVHEANRAAFQLYKGLGFIKNGERKSYYKGGGSAILFSYEKP